MIFVFLLSAVVCAACDPNLGLTHKGRHLTVPSIIAEKRFTSSTMVEHKELVDFSGLLVSIETWLFEFKEKQANMTSTNSFTNLADSAIEKEVDLEAETFQAISWNISSTMNSTFSHSTSSGTPYYHQFIQAHTPLLSPTGGVGGGGVQS